jgi:1-acyl-sn-glycerol-3-phosphate acyltransferase
MGWLRFVLDPPSVPRGVEPPAAERRAGVDYDTAWSRRPAAKLARRAIVNLAMRPAVAVYARPRIMGLDRLADLEPPVVFAANHHSHADTGVLLTAIPARFRRDLQVAAGADYFFPNRLTGAVSALAIGAVPIERLKLSRLSVDNVRRVVDDGHSLLIYPEGGRSQDGWGQAHRPGAAFVARRTGVAVVPVYIDGTGRVLPKGRTRPHRGRTAVVFGPPLRAGDGEDVRDFAARIQRAVDVLADEFTSGWWQARRRAHAGTTPRLDGPQAAAWRRRWALGPSPRQDRSRPRRAWPEP